MRTHSGNNNDDLSLRQRMDSPIALSLSVESPPCVMYGPAIDSPGAILSGVLTLTIKNPAKTRRKVSSNKSGANSLKATLSSGNEQSRKKNAIGTSLSSYFGFSSATNSSVKQNMASTSSSAMEKGSSYKNLTIKSVSLKFIQKIHFSKPFVPENHHIQSCANCKRKITEMKQWKIQETSIVKPIGDHSYPFSYLVPGSIPSTSSLGLSAETQIKYELLATVKYKDPFNSGKDNLVNLVMPVPITRSLHKGPDKNSLRVFPPTELTAAAVLPSVVFPKSTFPLEMKLDGVSLGDRRWRMRKLSWRLEETTRVRSNACSAHKADLQKLENEVKQKEIERGKKPRHNIKRYGDVGPQIRVAVSSPENMPLQRLRNNDNSNNRSSNGSNMESGAQSSSQPASATSNTSPSRRPQSSQDMDDDDDETDQSTIPFIHPSDDALRQEVLRQQQQAREERLEQEFKNNNSTLFTEEVRIISEGEMKSGWKTDFHDKGQIELVTEIDCMSLNSGVSNAVRFVSTAKSNNDIDKRRQSRINIAADIQDPDLGIYVNHILAVEIVVAEEALHYASGQPIKVKSSQADPPPSNKSNPESNADQRLAELSPMFANRTAPKARALTSSRTATDNMENDPNNSSTKIVSVPTGAARVLRMQFRLNVAERSGLGISWDDEVPPLYQDIKEQSPPDYVYAVKSTDANSKTVSESDGMKSNESDILELRKVMTIAVPPLAHAHDAGTKERRMSLADSQSPSSDHLKSLRGTPQFGGQRLSPSNTTTVVRNISHALDGDTITQ
ncbi:hypothetical protein KAFR_0D01180 [Kazachstania africana CBS 2517]|uniref:LDB19 N-terminal domain-containing protein n=1 Tax=Kazachstania africana (strain ATCC 22294 / BCRC 22015 / CBS 2517 / CECT 1963 / NBRC 1671 / NRRL Y-8276) TaxID=1071382 RepID=H2ATR4_KAZAF|nr:hypothetical protein KAFR_0D01180 [Kazachstania africana CBS 2517]CCF57764.1 hypothetical protein KAFR_0D01180 [Kazachstania africana CBS 2517]